MERRTNARTTERTNERTNVRTNERTDERKSENYIPPHTSYVGGIKKKNVSQVRVIPLGAIHLNPCPA